MVWVRKMFRQLVCSSGVAENIFCVFGMNCFEFSVSRRLGKEGSEKKLNEAVHCTVQMLRAEKKDHLDFLYYRII